MDPEITTKSGPLLVNAAQAGDLAERLAGFYLFPAVVEGTNKRPLCPWQSHAATGREAVTSLWERFAGYNEDGTPAASAVGLACDPSGIFIIDEDREWRVDPANPTDNDAERQAWATAIDSCDSLVMPSSLKARPHYYFRQPSDGQGRIAERVWLGGEVKSKGYVVLAAADPIYQPSAAGGGLWTPADVKEAIPPLIALIGRRRSFGDDPNVASSDTSYYGHRVTKEEFAAWLGQEPGEHFGGRLIGEEYEERFLSQLTDRFRQSVDRGDSRRTACLAVIHQAVIESYQGLYSLQAAYDAIADTYEHLRTYGPGDCSGDKGWNQRRSDDFQGMWESEIHKPDALRAAEASYDELVDRFSNSGVNMEISEADLEEDALCMDIIFAASDEQDEPANTQTPSPSQEERVEVKHCSNCNRTHKFINSWPGCDPAQPHGFLTYTGMEGACQFCGGQPSDALHSLPSTEPEPAPIPTDDEISWDDVVTDPVPVPVPTPESTTKNPIVLGEAAKRGVLWDLASGLIGKHELPHESLMITLAGWAGCVLGAVGAGAMQVSEDRHGPELCVCMVGTSAISHKSGTVSFGHMVFKPWWDELDTYAGAPGLASGYFREVSGIESGQAFVEVWPTAAETAGGEGIGRAVIMVEKELTTMWKKAARKGSTIPEEIRKAWDNDLLAVRGVRAGNHRILPANYRFSAVGATIHSLAARTIVESEADIDGSANRWLWCWGQEVDKPVKGQPSFDKHPLVLAVRDQVKGLIQSVERARAEGWWPGSTIGPGGINLVEFGEPTVWWSNEADQMWLGDEGTPLAGKGVYADLQNEVRSEAPGSQIVKNLKGRGPQQVMRLAIGYEMLKAGPGWAGLVRDTLRADGKACCISVEALNWALAVWRYCADTVVQLFSNTTGDSKIDELVSAISEIGKDQGKRFNGFVLKTDVVGSGFSKNSITALLAEAEKQGAIWQGNIRKEGRGSNPVVIGLPEWTPPPEVLKRRRGK